MPLSKTVYWASYGHCRQADNMNGIEFSRLRDAKAEIDKALKDNKDTFWRITRMTGGRNYEPGIIDIVRVGGPDVVKGKLRERMRANFERTAP